MKRLNDILKIGILVLLTACGGGGGSDTTPPSENNDVKSKTISGAIIDGEISAATIFLDLNRNGTLDSDEPSATSNSDGTYSLVLTATQQSHKNYINRKAPLVVYGGVDIRTGEAFEDYLTAIIEEGNSTNVTPLTTLIAETLGEELDQDVNDTISNIESKMNEIKANLTELLGINQDLLTKNPIELAKDGNMTLIDNNLQMHKIAKKMQKAMRKEVKSLRRSILKSYRAMAKSLKKLKKSAIKSGDTAFVAALEDAFDDNDLFDSALVSNVKDESQALSRNIRDYWRRNNVRLDDADITTALNGLELVIVEGNSSIVNDTEKPVIILLGRKVVNINQGTVYVDMGAIARDNKDGDLTGSMVVNNSVDISKLGIYTVTYDVTDSSGNVANQVSRTVTVSSNGTITGTDTVKLSNTEAFKFLNLATFGTTKELQNTFQEQGVEKWLEAQLTLPYQADMHLKRTIKLAKKVEPSKNPNTVAEYLAENDTVFNKEKASIQVRRFQMSAWFEGAVFDEEQLRHRVAYALSQIIVESLAEPTFKRRGEALARYFDILTKNAFGNYKDLLLDISHSSAMGLYLTYNGSKKTYTDGTTTIYPDENYARELMQLFTIGLYELNIDGSQKLSSGNPIATYTQEDVNNVARVFTGWDMKQTNKFGRVSSTQGDLTHPLEFTAEHHDSESKTVLSTSIPSGNDGSQDIEAVINILMNNANIAPFISKQLIMRLTKSNPSPAYVARVATVFNDNGQGVKGDLKAVVKAIYLDDEILENLDKVQKYKEPILAYTQMLRAFKVEKMPKWTFAKSPEVEVSDALLINDPSPFLGQAPARAFTVFNFYDNNYIPNDTTFKNEKLVAPELQIQTDSMLIAFHNQISRVLKKDKRRLIKKHELDLNSFSSVMNSGSNIFFYREESKLLLDLSDVYSVMEQELEGTVDGNIENLKRINRSDDSSADSDGISNRDRALKALIETLDKKLTAGLLETAYKEFLFETYKEEMYTNWRISNNDATAKTEVNIHDYIMTPIIAAIISSDTYMVQ